MPTLSFHATEPLSRRLRQRAKAAKIPLSPAFLPQHPWDYGDMAVRDEQLAPWPRTPADNRRQRTRYYYSCYFIYIYYYYLFFIG